MIGCIVTGHGDLAPGLAQAVGMIAGPQEHFRVVPFRDLDPLETYESELRAALDALLAETDGVVIFTDLLGGTPFRAAMLAAADHANVAVVTGTNLPMLVEVSLLRAGESDVQALARQAVDLGQTGVQTARLPQADRPGDPAEDTGGI